MSKKSTAVILILAVLFAIAFGLAIYADNQNFAKEDRFCESKGMTRLPNKQSHVQCITEDGDIKHFSRDKVRNMKLNDAPKQEGVTQ